MDRKLFTTLVAFSACLAALWLLGRLMGPFWMPLGWACVLAVLTWPLYGFVHRVFRQSDSMAATAMLLLVVVVLMLPLTLSTYLIGTESAHAYHYCMNLDRAAAINSVQALLAKPELSWLRSLLESTLGPVASLVAEAQTLLQEKLNEVAQTALKLAGSGIKGAGEMAFKCVFMLFFLFFLYKDGARMRDTVMRNLPLHQEVKDLVTTSVQKVLSAYLYGILVTAATQALVAWLGFYSAGLPSPLLLGVLTAAAGFIPVVGTALIWAPAALWLFANGHTVAAIALAAWCALVIVLLIDHVAKPAVMGRLVNLPVPVIFVGALGGIVAFGVIGAISGPLVLALCYNLYMHYDRVEAA